MGDVVSNIFSPKVPEAPPVFTANDGTIWQSQAEADARNAEVQQQQDRSEARARGYTGEFGAGGYGRFQQDYAPDPNNPGGRWIAKNSANIDRAGRDVTSERDAARAAGYTGDWGTGGWQQFQAQKSAEERNNQQRSEHESRMAEIQAQRQEDNDYFKQRLQEIQDDRKKIESKLPTPTNETKAKSARSELYKRLFGRRSLLSSTSRGFARNTALGG